MTGSIVTFDDAIPFMPIEKLVAQIEPQQDLHGYDAPWAGGAGKNLFDQDTCTTGKYIDAYGEPKDSAGAEYSDYIPVTIGQQYVFSGTNNTGGQATTRVHGYNSSKVWVQQITSESVADNVKWNTSFTVPEGISFVRVSTGYPLPDGQLEKGSTATAWTPYANECPITGWDGLSGKRDGKNLLDVDDFTLVKSSARTKQISFPYLPAGQYTLSVYVPSNTATKTVQLAIRDKPINPYVGIKTLGIPAGETGTFSTSFTADIPFSYIYAYMSTSDRDDASITVEDVQLETGLSATTYEAYTSLPIAVSWQSEAGTVYGGTVDVVTGVLTAMDVIAEYDGSSDESWTVIPSTNRAYISAADIKTDTPDSQIGIVASNQYKPGTYNGVHVTRICSRYGIAQINVFDLALITADSTQATWKAHLAQSPLQVVYPLAEPQTYQLTPQQIETIVGQNNVWVDTGDVSVTYQSTSGSTPVRTSFKSPLASYSYNALKLFGNTFIEHGKG